MMFDDLIEIFRATQRALRRQWNEGNDRLKDKSLPDKERRAIAQRMKQAAKEMRKIADDIKKLTQ